MQWYVLQTTVGEEKKLVEMIHRIVPKHLYGECFVVYHEQLWRRKQKNFVQMKRAFPGYIFITSKEPEALFFCLKKLPAAAKLMADDESFFLSVDPEEAAFLEQIMDEQHIIRLSYLETDGNGMILQVSGPLNICKSQIVRCKFGKRYVLIRIKLLGREKNMLLGIVLNEDIRQEIQDKKAAEPTQLPEQYMGLNTKKEANDTAKKMSKKVNTGKTANKRYSAGTIVEVTDGVFQGKIAKVYQVKEKTVKAGILLFGQTIEVELPLEILRINE